MNWQNLLLTPFQAWKQSKSGSNAFLFFFVQDITFQLSFLFAWLHIKYMLNNEISPFPWHLVCCDKKHGGRCIWTTYYGRKLLKKQIVRLFHNRIPSKSLLGNLTLDAWKIETLKIGLFMAFLSTESLLKVLSKKYLATLFVKWEIFKNSWLSEIYKKRTFLLL